VSVLRYLKLIPDSKKLRTAVDSMTAFGGNELGAGILEFDLDTSLYADDAGFQFGTKEALVTATNIIYELLERMGLMMHVGRGDKASKTEAMFVPGYGRTYDEDDTDRFPVDGESFIDFCTIFPYLGSKISSDYTDEADIDNRIVQASKTFGYLRKKVLCSKRILTLTLRGYTRPRALSTLSHKGRSLMRPTASSRSSTDLV